MGSGNAFASNSHTAIGILGSIQEARHVHGHSVHGPPDMSLDIEYTFIFDYLDIINFITFLRSKLHELSII